MKFLCVMILLCAAVMPSVCHGHDGNFMLRIDVKARQDNTRLTFNFENDTKYSLSVLAGNRIRIAFERTYPFRSRKLVNYSDPRIEGIALTECNGCCVVTVTVKDIKAGYRMISPVRKNMAVLDIGSAVKDVGREPSWPGREKIWSGTERLIREFEPPVRGDLPFIPSEKKELAAVLDKEDVKQFEKGEAALYDEKAAEAEEIFRSFSSKEVPARGMAACRLGEALYLLQKYPEALSAFRDAQKYHPEYLFTNPAAVFDYADCLARGGAFEEARRMLARLIAGLAGTGHGTSLLVRLGDICRRAGHETEAIAIYRNIVSSFPGTDACHAAAMRLGDREFFAVNSATWRDLYRKYDNIRKSATVSQMRDEAMFKAALMQSLYGPPAEAAESVGVYEKKFPYGIFSNIAKSIHEHLLLVLYQKYDKEGNCRGLLGMMRDNSNYLSECIAEKGFARRISDCFRKNGMKREEMKFFMEIADSEWASESAPFMYSRIIEDALALNELPTAESAGRVFLERFPKNELAWNVTARLGEIYFRKGKMQEVVSLLSRLEKKDTPCENPECFYFLGKARSRLGDIAGAEKDMARFCEVLAWKNLSSPFEADAYMVRAEAMASRGDDKGAMGMYRSGYAVAGKDKSDAFLYKLGETSIRMGDVQMARNSWELLASEGKDPFWKKLAAEQLADLAWNSRWKAGDR